MADKSLEEQINEAVDKATAPLKMQIESLEEMAAKNAESTEALSIDAKKEEVKPITVKDGKDIFFTHMRQMKQLTKDGIKVINLEELSATDLKKILKDKPQFFQKQVNLG